MIVHKELAGGRWFTLSLMQQLANVGGDIQRTINWKRKGDLQSGEKAFERALELLDLTIADKKNHGSKRKELLRVREMLVDYFMFHNHYSSTDALWQNYFYIFNYRAALERGH